MNKTFLINLDRSQDRLNHFTHSASQHDLAFERISAVDGQHLTESQRSHYDPAANARHYHKPLGPGEVACYLSHRKAWQRIVDDKLAFAVILEDDAIVYPHLAESISLLGQLDPTQWEYIKLAEKPVKRKAIDIAKLGSQSLCVFDKVPAGTTGQAVSYQGAKKLLAHSETFCRPVDVDIQRCWEKDLDVFGMHPYPVCIETSYASEINKMADRYAQRNRHWVKLKNMLTFKLHNARSRPRLRQRLSKLRP